MLRILTTAIALWGHDSKSVKDIVPQFFPSIKSHTGWSFNQVLRCFPLLKEGKKKNLLLGTLSAGICHIRRRHCRTSLQIPEYKASESESESESVFESESFKHQGTTCSTLDLRFSYSLGTVWHDFVSKLVLNKIIYVRGALKKVWFILQIRRNQLYKMNL